MDFSTALYDRNIMQGFFYVPVSLSQRVGIYRGIAVMQ